MQNAKKSAEKVGHTNISLLRRLAAILIVGYVAFIVLFYFLAGEQLHLRESRGDLALPAAESGTVELAAGSIVDQTFTVEIQRLEKVGVQWGTYYRPNAGTVVLELYDVRTNTLLMSQQFDAAAIVEGGLTEMVADTPLEGLYQAPLLLRVYSLDSQPGSAVSPLMNTQAAVQEGFSLSLNGTPVQGTLCFAVSGTDYIWTGLHYWEFSAAGLALILLFLGAVWCRVRKGKRSYVISRLICSGYTIVFILVCVMSLGLLVFGRTIQAFLEARLPVIAEVTGHIINFRAIWAALVLMVFFLGIYTFVPDRRLTAGRGRGGGWRRAAPRRPPPAPPPPGPRPGPGCGGGC